MKLRQLLASTSALALAFAPFHAFAVPQGQTPDVHTLYFQPQGIWPTNNDAHLDPEAFLPPPIGFDPKKHLAAFSHAVAQGRSPVVCETGDSLYAIYDPVNNVGGVDAISPSETPLAELREQIAAQNPGVTPTFVNRAVGGQTWYYLSTSPLTAPPTFAAPFPSWYAYTAMHWLSYIRGADCDTVFINLGGNDRATMFASFVYNALSEIASWGTAPPAWAPNTAYGPAVGPTVQAGTEIIDTNGDLEVTVAGGVSGSSPPTFATTFNGTNTTLDGTITWVNVSGGVYTPRIPDITLITNGGATTNSAPYNTSAYQIGYLTAAAFTRGLGENGGTFLGIPGLPPLGLIDKGRYFDGVFYGFDPAAEYLALVPSQTGLVVPGSSFPVIGTYPTNYSQYSFPTTNAGDVYFDITFPGQAVAMQGNTLNFNLGGYAGTGSTAQLKIFRSLAGGVRVQYSVDGVAASAAAGTDITTTVPWGTGDIRIQLYAKQSGIQLLWNQTQVVNMVEPRWVGSYTPTLAILPLGTPFSGTMTINNYATGTYLPTLPRYSAQWMYDYLGILGEGGDKVAHPTSADAVAIDQAVIRSINFHAQTLGQTAGTATNDNAAPGNVGEFISSRCGNTGIGGPATITIASPAAISWTGANISGVNGRDDICPFELTTTGALPSGLEPSTLYWTVPQNGVINIASSLANALAGTVITTSGTQSGTQTVVSGYPLTSLTTAGVTALMLTAGDWDVAGNGYAVTASSTVTSSEVVGVQTGTQCVSSPPVLGASPGISGGNASWYGSLTSLTEIPLIGVGPSRVSLAATSVVCLLEKDGFATSTANGLGYIGARRAR